MTPDNRVNTVTDKDTPLSATSPTLPSIKDMRAFEHDRQRVKKAADLVKMRARKEQGRWATLAKGGLYNSSRKITGSLASEKGKRLDAEDVDGLDGSLADSGCDVDGVAFSPQPSEVKLSDLVAFRSKPRKGQDGDFEVIPHVRSVIVLDDITTHDLMVDEPWEHIYGSDEEEIAAATPTKGPSYAHILSSITK